MNKNTKLRVAIAGASGYVGGELMRYLSLHPHVEIVARMAASNQGQSVEALFPNLRGFQSGPLDGTEWDEVGRKADVVFVSLPHGQAQEPIARLIEAGTRVVDMGGDYRLKDKAVFEDFYETEHRFPELLAEAVYGMPELHREKIRSARLVANPGCYPTASLLALLPLARAGVLTGPVIVDAKSGVSGAGRSPGPTILYSEVNENLRPYNVERHRHRPEIEQGLAWGGQDCGVVFTPQLAPMTRGILATVYAPVRAEVDYAAFYANEPFVQVLERDLPCTKGTAGGNFCHLAVRRTSQPNLLLIMSAIDNLGKGAAGTAVHNLNLMFDFPEETALRCPALFP